MCTQDMCRFFGFALALHICLFLGGSIADAVKHHANHVWLLVSGCSACGHSHHDCVC